jgi:hypothetical protein
MTRFRTPGRWFRIAIAVAFGFMSLGHGPIMTFAHAGQHGPTSHDRAIHASGHHNHAGHHQTADAEDGGQAAVHELMVCNAFGCFVTVAVPPVNAPSQQTATLGKLSPSAPRPGLATSLEPADPPPRLHG